MSIGSWRMISVPAAMALHDLFDVLELQLLRQGHHLVRPEGGYVESRDSDQDVKITARDGHGFQPGALIGETPDLSFGVGDLAPAGRESHGIDRKSTRLNSSHLG